MFILYAAAVTLAATAAAVAIDSARSVGCELARCLTHGQDRP